MHHPLLDNAPRHSRLVGAIKRALWILAGLLAFILIAISWMNGGESGSRIVLSSTSSAGHSEASVMRRPHYLGVDEKNRPFTILADSATQPDSNTVILSNVSADMTTEEHNWLAVTAGNGIYHSDSKTLHLAGGTSLFYEGGFEFRSEEADIDINAGTAAGNRPVEGQSPTGILKADRFKVLDRGKILQFNGHVYVTLYR